MCQKQRLRGYGVNQLRLYGIQVQVAALFLVLLRLLHLLLLFALVWLMAHVYHLIRIVLGHLYTASLKPVYQQGSTASAPGQLAHVQVQVVEQGLEHLPKPTKLASLPLAMVLLVRRLMVPPDKYLAI
jgi:hypothetical protein